MLNNIIAMTVGSTNSDAPVT